MKRYARNEISARELILNEYFSAKVRGEGKLWMRGDGYSMLPLFGRSAKLLLRPCRQSPSIGQVIVVPRSNRLVAHRVVDHDSQAGKWITKGDSLFWFDYPVDLDEIIGRVDLVYFLGRRKHNIDDYRIAEYSRRLGHWFEGHCQAWPGFAKHLLYLLAYSLVLFALFVTRLTRRRHSNSRSDHGQPDDNHRL